MTITTMGILPSMMKLARPIEECPIIEVSQRDFVERFLGESNFITVDCYSSNVTPEPGESGYLAIVSGREIYPVVRVRPK